MSAKGKDEALVVKLVKGIQSRKDQAAELNSQLTVAKNAGDNAKAQRISKKLSQIELEDNRDWKFIIDKYQFQMGHFLSAKFSGLTPFDLQDIVQETYLKVTNKIHTFGWQSTFKTWQFKIAYNSAINYIEKNKRTPTVLGMSFDEFDSVGTRSKDIGSHPTSVVGPSMVNEGTYHSADPESFAIGMETERRIFNAIENLPPKLKEALILCDVELKTYMEISEITDTNIGTVRSRIHRARSKVFTDTGIGFGKKN